MRNRPGGERHFLAICGQPAPNSEGYISLLRLGPTRCPIQVRDSSVAHLVRPYGPPLNRRDFLRAATGFPLCLAARPLASVRGMPSSGGTVEAACASLIPAGDGMPSAAATQAPAYVLRRSATDANVALNLSTVVETLDRLALQRFKSPFAHLPDAHRILILRTCERASPDVFSFLVNTVYEGYYTDARVLRLLDARCDPPRAVSAEALLAPVRRKFGAGRPE